MNSLVVDIVVKTSIVLALGAVIDFTLRRRASAAVRHFVWTVAIAAVLVLPLASVTLPAWDVSVPVLTPAAARGVVEEAPPSAAFARVAGATRSRGAALPETATPAASTRQPFDVFAFAFAIYSAGVVVLLFRLLAEEFAVRRLAARAAAGADAGWLEPAVRGAKRLGIRRHVRLLHCDEHVMPFTFGTVRPTIVLPETAARWTSERREAVVLHELAHVARRDCLAQRLASLASALYWPHPGVWWAARRLRVEREFACDDRVLSAGAGARDYAHHLLEIAHTFRATPAPATALGMARARQLERRLLAIIDDERNRGGLRRHAAVGIAATAAALVLPIASLHAEFGKERGPRASYAAPAALPDGAGLTVATGDPVQSRGQAGLEEYSGTWELQPAREPGMVNVRLRTAHSENGTTVPLSRFAGISGEGMTAAVRDGRITDGTVHFTSRREAGTFTFDGVCRNERCGGTYSFAPDPAFPSRLAKYGIGTPTAVEQYEMAIEDVGVAYLEGLKGEGYAVPDVHTLVRAAEHGVSLEYAKSMAGLGYRLGTLDLLIRMRDHGVDPDYVRGLAAQGFTRLDADELVRLRDHGVDPDYVKGMRDAGYGSATVANLVQARDHGVDPAFAGGIAALGYRNVPLETLVRLRDHGVDPAYVRGLGETGRTNVPLDALIRMRDHGVDPAFVRGVAAAGYEDVPIDSLIRMRDHGVDPEYIRRVQARGARNLSIDDLIRMRDRGGE